MPWGSWQGERKAMLPGLAKGFSKGMSLMMLRAMWQDLARNVPSYLPSGPLKEVLGSGYERGLKGSGKASYA